MVSASMSNPDASEETKIGFVKFNCISMKVMLKLSKFHLNLSIDVVEGFFGISFMSRVASFMLSVALKGEMNDSEKLTLTLPNLLMFSIHIFGAGLAGYAGVAMG